MADFSISQFKQYVQTFINATGIDDGNGVIETKNGELSKLLSNFGLEESQIGDLLEKSDNSTNNARGASSANQPSSDDIHNDFLNAQEKYDNMTEQQQKDVREQTIQKATDSYNEMSEILNMPEPCYPPGPADLITDVPSDNKDKIIEFVVQKVTTNAKSQCAHMLRMITQYDTAFSGYDVTYRSPFEVKQPTCVPQTNENNIADACMSMVMTKLQEFLSQDFSSLTMEELADSANKLATDVHDLIQERANYIETVGNEIAENYKNDFKLSIEALQKNKYITPPTCQPSDFEPQIAIVGAPIEKTFTDVVNSATTGITSVRTDSKQAPIYDLSGKQVTGDLQKGQVYIQNGKKIVAQ